MQPNSSPRNGFGKKSKGRVTPQPLHLQQLEARENPAPIATVQGLAAAGATRPLLGDSVSYGFNFTNTDATDVGFGPYIVVAVDSTGPDGAATPANPTDDDGFGVPVVRSTGTILSPLGKTVLGATLKYDNPFTGQTGLSAPAGYQPGDTIYIYQLPFISFTPGQTTDVDISLPTSNKADVNVPLNLTVIPAFRDVDPVSPFSPQISAPVNTDAIPQLYRLEKIYLGPEDETATGPNFIRRYRLDVDIATGQTINALSLTDDLSNSMQIVSRTKTNMAAFVAGSGFGTNILDTSKLGGTATTTAPDGTITYNFGNVTGVAGNDASFEFDFYVPRDNAGGATQVVSQTPLNNAITGTDSTTSQNTASSTGNWTPIDPRDPTGPVPKSAPDNGPHTLEQQSIAIQKGFELIDRMTGTVLPAGSPIRPGNMLVRYSLNFQVSDYYAFDDVFVRDVLADGQRLYIGTFGSGGAQSAFPLITVNNAFLTGSPAGSRITSNSTAAGGLPANRFTGNQVIEYQQRYSPNAASDPTSFPVTGPQIGTIGASVFLNQAPAIDTNLNTGGSSLIQFNISQELRARHGANAGRLVGGDIADAGSNPNNNPIGSQLFTGTTGTIVFYAEVTEEFSDAFPTGDRTVDQGDILGNTVNDPTTPQRDGIFGTQLRTEQINAATPTTIGTGSDDSSTSILVPYGEQEKQIYAINGQRVPQQGTGTPLFNVQPGDIITYHLTYTLPISSFEDLRLIDLAPLPVLDVDNQGAFNFIRNPASYTFNAGNVGVYVTGQTPGSTGSTFLDDTYFNTFAPGNGSGRNPVLSTNSIQNNLTLNFGTHDDTGFGNRRSTRISVLVSFVVSNDPFAQDLPLTNQLRVLEGSTNAGTATSQAIRQFELVRPFLTIQKGAVGGRTTGLTGGSGASQVVFTPPSNATGTFTLGGSALSSANALDNSTEAGSIGGLNITNSNPRVDAGDVVRFAIVAQNSGQGDAFDVNITDTIQPDFDRTSFTNLRLFRGDGTALVLNTDYTFTYDNTTGALSITLVDNYTAGNVSTTAGVPVAVEDARSGALSRGQGNGGAVTNGSNTVIALYDVTLASTVAPGQTITNTAAVSKYSNSDNGPDYTDPAIIPGATDLTDQATVTTPVNLVKQLVSSSEAHTTGNDVVIGEVVRYRLVAELAEGKATNLQILDRLPNGLTFINDGTAKVAFLSNGTGITSSTLSGAGLAVSGTATEAKNVTTVPSFVVPGAAISPTTFSTGKDVTFNLGDVSNNDRDDDLEFIVIEFNALIDNTSTGNNQAGNTRNNDFQLLVGGSAVATSGQVGVRIVEPQITTVKDASPTSADAGDLVTYTVTISNPGTVTTTTTAFEVRFTDLVPSTLTGVGYSIGTLPGGVSVVSDTSSGNNLNILFNQLGVGQAITITITGNVIATVSPGQVITNIANTVWTSLPGDNGTTTNPTGSANTGTPGSDTGERTGTGGINDYAGSDPADVTINPIVPVKTVLTTSELASSGNNVLVGEIVRYRLQVRVPESDSLPNFRINDAIPAGLQFLNDGSARVGFVTNSTGITSSTLSGTGLTLTGNETTVNTLTPTFVVPGAGLLGGPFTDGTDVIFALGDLNNQDRDADQEFIVIEFNALVLNVASNQAGTTLSNTFQVSINGTNSGPASNAADVIVREPSVSINKEIIATTGGVVTYRITVTNSSAANTATAFNTRVLDILDGTNLSLIGGSITTPTFTGGAAGFTNSTSGNTVDISIDTMPLGSTATFTYQANVLTTPTGTTTLANTGKLTYTSLPDGNGSTTNPTGSSTPGNSGDPTGERGGSGGVNDLFGSDTERLGSIGDRVWLDGNGDGVQDANEPGLIGVPVSVRWAGPNGTFGDGDDSLVNTITGANGIYTVTGLPVDSPGQFRVIVNTGAPLFTTLGLSKQTFDATAPTTDSQSQIAITTANPNPRNQDFGYRGDAKLGDTVWLDTNKNGKQDAGEPGLGNVGVSLTWFGQDGVAGGGDDYSYTTTTNTSGFYQFTNLPAGNFNVLVDSTTLPTGLNQTFDLDDNTGPTFATANSALTTLTISQDRQDVDFGYVGTGKIGDTVWYDVNGNGTQETGVNATEPGIPNAKVVLTFAGKDGKLATAADNFTRTLTTDANGQYLFTGLPGGDFDGTNPNYTLQVTSPAGYTTQTFDPTTPTTDNTSSLQLGNGATNLLQDFGYRGPAGIELGDYVWEDLNGNGKQDNGEPGIVGLSLFLLDANGNKIASTATDVNGKYLFGNLVDSSVFGKYAVQFVPIPGYVFTAQNQTYAGMTTSNDSDANPVDGKTALYNLTAGKISDKTADAGLYRPISLGDQVWYDQNKNGNQDAGEPGINGVLITAIWRGPDGVPSADDQTFTTVTGTNGKWSIGNLPPGHFTVSVSQLPDGVAPTYDLDSLLVNPDGTTAVTTTSGVDRTDVDFGFAGDGKLGDTIFLDVNGNNLFDGPNEGLAGVRVFAAGDLNGDGTLETLTTTTDGNGFYQFVNLRTPTAGLPYTVTVDATTLPRGVGLAAVVNTVDPDGGNDNTSKTTLSSGQPSDQAQDFGYRGPGQIGDTIFLDVNDNKQPDAGEGITGVQVLLTADIDGDGTFENFTTTTDANGKYLFRNLPVADNGSVIIPYTVTVGTGLPQGVSNTVDPDGSTKGTTQVSLSPTNAVNLQQDFGYRGPGSVGDRVFLDLNNDKLYTPGEGITGVVVTLQADINGDGTPETFTATTDAEGFYSFTGLPVTKNDQPLAYTVTVLSGLPTGVSNTSDPDGANDNKSVVTLSTTTPNNDLQDFGYQGTAKLGDRVWLDINQDGKQDPASVEPGLTKIGLTLLFAGQDGTFGNGDDISTMITTGADGLYLFQNLPPGNYRVTVDGTTLPGNLTPTFDFTSPFNGVADKTLSLGEDFRGLDFGYVGNASVGDRVWLDQNTDGVQQPLEAGVPNATVVLRWAGADRILDNADDLSFTATTDTKGNYLFTGLPVYGPNDDYRVTVTKLPISGLKATYDLDSLLVNPDQTAKFQVTSSGANQNRRDVDFGYDGTSQLAGTVHFDRNNDGTQQTGEPGIAGVVLTLTGRDVFGNEIFNPTTGKPYSTTTDANGKYLFDTLIPGTYQINEAQPTSFNDGIDRAGTLGGNAGNDVISGIPVGPDQSGVNYDFGEVGTFLSGTVFRDDNGDGTQQPGEPGLPGVVIQLVDKTNDTTITTTTDANGNYRFDGLPIGNYTITETQPAGYANSPGTPATSKDVTLPLTGLTNQNFGEQLGSLAGTVYVDANNSGTLESGETRLPNVPVVFTGTDAAGNKVNRTAFTDVNGNYKFDLLLAPDLSGYTVTEGATPPFTDGKANVAGTAGGTATSPNQFTSVALTAGQNASNYNFSERQPANPFLSGSVFFDANKSTTRDTSEPGISGVTVTLRGAGPDGFFGTADDKFFTQTTDANGNYLFDNLTAGAKYRIDESQPLIYGSTTPNLIEVNSLPATGLTNQNFGEILGSVAGKVYFDANANGALNPTEPGIPGTTVVLTGTDVNGVSLTRTTTTDGQGQYKFAKLPAGTYVVTETQPTGYLQGTNNVGSVGGNIVAGDKLTGIVLGGDVDAVQYNFGEIGTPVSGQVFVDANRDGQLTQGESPLPATVIQLIDKAGTVIGTTTTGQDGKYQFFNVPPGQYNLLEVQPTGYGDPLTGPFAPNTRPITVAGTPIVDQNFGDTLSSLAGAVYLDIGNDGIRNAGEAGVSGVTMLLDSAGTDGVFGTADEKQAIRSAVTDFNGNYLFDGLFNGVYRVRESAQPAPILDGRETAGNIGGDINTNDSISVIPLPAGTQAINYNFGELPPLSPPGTTFVAGTVYLDRNQNGKLDSNEVTLPGVPVVLEFNVAGVPQSQTVTTDANGNYTFTGLNPALDYTVRETQPTAYASGPEEADNFITLTTIPLTGQTGLNFGETPSSISGNVYFDANNSKTLNNGDIPLSLAQVVLTGNGITRTTTTDSAGSYQFSDLPAGTYTLTETQPTGYAQGTNTPGTGATLGTTTDTLSVALPAGGASPNNTFGEVGTTLSGTVFRDDNRDGTQQTSEPAIPGTIITLIDRNGQPIATATTGTDGSYQFTNVPPGNYTIRETQPAGYGNSPNTPTTERTVTVAGTPINNLNFGETLGRLSGFVYEDYDINGVRTTGSIRPDRGIAGITVTLFGTDQFGRSVLQGTTTDANGAYSFDNLFPGAYRIVETQPRLPQAINDGGYYDARDNLGSLAGSNTVKNELRVTLGNDANELSQVGTDYNFGEVPPADPFGFVYEDLNNNGIKDPNEPGIPGAIVTLGGLVNDVFLGLRPVQAADIPGGLNRTTDANGRYEFVPIPAGTYTLSEAQPAGFLDGREQNGDTNLPATVTVGQDNFGNIVTGPFQIRGPFNFGELRPSSIAGTVYLDSNRNGVRDAGETGIAGVTMTLNGTNDLAQPISTKLITDADGNFNFTNLRPGSYTLIEAQPQNLLQGSNVIGSAGGAIVATDQIGLINLGVGQNGINYLYGEQPPLPPTNNRPAPVPPLPPLTPIISVAPGAADPSKRQLLGSTPTSTTTNRVPTERTTPNFAALGSVNTTRPTQFLSTAEGVNGELVRVFDMSSGQERFRFRPFPGNPGGVRTTTADLNGDGIPDIITAAGRGGGPRVIAYDGNNGSVLRDFMAFEMTFTGGLFLASGDFNGDGQADLVITPDEGGGPRVRVLASGDPNRVIADFFGIDDPNFRGGARAAAGDINNDGVADLVVSAGFGGGPRVALFDGRSLSTTPTRLAPDFFAFENTLRNGVYLAVSDVDGDRFADLIFGAGPGGAPRVTAFSGQSLISSGGLVPVANFFAGDTSLRGGVRVAAQDFNGDGLAEVVTGSAQTELPIVRFFNPRTGQLLDEFYAQYLEYTGGIFVG